MAAQHRAVADSLEEAGDRLFTFTRLPPSQWRSARTTNAIERLHEEFKRRIKTQTVLPSADTAAMLFWALLASGQINMRKVDGWQTLEHTPLFLAESACAGDSSMPARKKLRNVILRPPHWRDLPKEWLEFWMRRWRANPPHRPRLRRN